jgi:hypothetical protein
MPAMVPVTEVRERFYGVTAERTLRHPAVVALAGAARARLTSGTAS